MITSEGIKKAEELLAQYLIKYHPPGKKRVFLTMHFAPSIAEDLLEEARALYAFYDPQTETPLFLFREASYSVPGAGFLVTTKAIYYYLGFSFILADCLNSYDLDDILSFQLKREGFFKGTKVIINGLPAASIIAIKKRERQIVMEFMNELIRINNQEKEAIRRKYNLEDRDPLVYISDLYEQFKAGNLDRGDYIQRKQELLRVI